MLNFSDGVGGDNEIKMNPGPVGAWRMGSILAEMHKATGGDSFMGRLRDKHLTHAVSKHQISDWRC